MAEIESFAPMMAYLVRSMQSGGDLAKMLWRTMIDNAEGYIDEGVRAGTIKPSRDPKARALFLAMSGGGGFMLYLQMHDNPADIRAVLHDYAQDMVLPALEVYTQGLMTDSTMYDAFLAQHDKGIPSSPPRNPTPERKPTDHDHQPRKQRDSVADRDTIGRKRPALRFGAGTRRTGHDGPRR
jgi:hypothetical protein